MTKRLVVGLTACGVALAAASPASANTVVGSEDFDSGGVGDWSEYNATIENDSGTLRVTGDDEGAYSYYAGAADEDFRTTPLGDGYISELDVYLDPAASGGFDLSVAASRLDGSHLRDFIFHVGQTDGAMLVNGSNNTDFTLNPSKLAGGYEVTELGWYTLQHVLRPAADEVSLAVDLNLIGSEGTVLWTETRNNPADQLTDVGSPRYQWITFVNGSFAFDNQLLERIVPEPVTPEPDPSQLRVTFMCKAIDGGDILNDDYAGVDTEYPAGSYVWRVREEAGVGPVDYTVGVSPSNPIDTGTLQAGETRFFTTDTAFAGVSVFWDDTRKGTASSNENNCSYAAPDAPTNVFASAANRSATVAWDAPADNGSPITSYEVTASPGDVVCSSSTTSCTISDLTNGQPYTFTVIAINAGGASATSEPSAPVTPMPTCGGVPATILGSSAGETIRGTSGRDVIVALGGNDTIYGYGGNDLICAGAGNDKVLAGPGADVVFGQLGADLLFGQRDNDVLRGWRGNDALIGGPGSDRTYGGPGQDRVVFRAAPRGVTVDLGAGTATGWGRDTIGGVENAVGSNYTDTLRGSGAVNRLSGGRGNDTLVGRAGNDVLFGNRGADLAYGGRGDDAIYGQLGDDRLFGQAGNDRIYGGQQSDRCWGASGRDQGFSCEARYRIP